MQEIQVITTKASISGNKGMRTSIPEKVQEILNIQVGDIIVWQIEGKEVKISKSVKII